LEFRVLGLGFRVWDLGFRVEDFDKIGQYGAVIDGFGLPRV
jgi:hypothetical protein